MESTNKYSELFSTARRSHTLPIYVIVMLTYFMTFDVSSLAQINCQSEIYLQAKPDPTDRFQKG